MVKESGQGKMSQTPVDLVDVDMQATTGCISLLHEE